MRVGCLFVHDLPLQAILRAEPTLAGTPVAVAEGEGARARVRCVSVPAHTQGVRPGLSVGDALSLAPELVVRWTPPELFEAARAAVLDAAASVSPRVEEARPGVALIDARGLEKLHGGDRGVASALVAAASRLGLDGRASVASGKTLAQIAAVRGAGVEVVPRGGERAFLAPLSAVALGADAALAQTLARWGIATAGELAALPANGIGARLGASGVRLHRLASGVDDEPLHPLQPPERFEEGADFDFELAAVEGLLFVIRPALERLVDRLDCHAMACGSVQLRLLLDPSGEAILPVELAAPTRDVPSLLALCRSILERRPPGAAVRGVRVIAVPAAARHEQLRLFGRPTVAPEKLATALAKVAAIVGDDRVGTPALADSHVNDSFTMSRFDPPPPPDELPRSTGGSRAGAGRDVSLAAEPPSRYGEDDGHVGSLRLFRPALVAEVREARGGPQALRAGAIAGWVVTCAGPWRLDVGWHETPTCRDAFDVELSDGAVYRLARDFTTGEWSLVGRYD
ncbi:DNA polymerase Y family protein [Vulgatibacter incomptus]|uniref:DNA polymerase IV-like protein ImuB n=1 Tax=Vulgatibacter incomptus TaxID=1391653 RepID=A0A0K1PID8_9BACT|nr:DNA polymerase Y family protein [Vulgatibacter incomptus]AKU93267.1 DNA polymerase IV-like protein ImuB [Vulgatibacter incomptus]